MTNQLVDSKLDTIMVKIQGNYLLKFNEDRAANVVNIHVLNALRKVGWINENNEPVKTFSIATITSKKGIWYRIDLI